LYLPTIIDLFVFESFKRDKYSTDNRSHIVVAC
jgi:hypothetical protein